MTPLIIFGASGHARVIADAAKRSGEFELLGLVDRDLPLGGVVDGHKVLGNESELPSLVAGRPDVRGIIGIGANDVRARLAAAIRREVAGFRFANVVHPAAVIASDVKLGEGVFVAASATINCGTKIGNHVVINTGACVDHDCDIGDFGFVAPNATLAGAVKVGASAFIGSGAVLIPLTSIGANAVVGAGGVVVEAVEQGATVVGVPARQVKG